MLSKLTDTTQQSKAETGELLDHKNLGGHHPGACKASHVNMTPPAMDTDLAAALNDKSLFSEKEYQVYSG